MCIPWPLALTKPSGLLSSLEKPFFLSLFFNFVQSIVEQLQYFNLICSACSPGPSNSPALVTLCKGPLEQLPCLPCEKHGSFLPVLLLCSCHFSDRSHPTPLYLSLSYLLPPVFPPPPLPVQMSYRLSPLKNSLTLFTYFFPCCFFLSFQLPVYISVCDLRELVDWSSPLPTPFIVSILHLATEIQVFSSRSTFRPL